MAMWFSFWVTVSFGVAFVLIEVAFDRPLPLGVGIIPATVVSVMTNGWEAFWHWRFYYQDKLCVEAPSTGKLRCWDASSLKIPDGAHPPDPPGYISVMMPWFGETSMLHWFLTSVPIDLAAAGVAAGLVWVAFRPFGQHKAVERVINPLD